MAWARLPAQTATLSGRYGYVRPASKRPGSTRPRPQAPGSTRPGQQAPGQRALSQQEHRPASARQRAAASERIGSEFRPPRAIG